MPRRSVLVWGAIVAIAAIVLICGAYTYSTCIEYYGSEPPYYGRTENMDKWESPVAGLALWNGVGLILSGAIGWLAWGATRAVAPRTESVSCPPDSRGL